MTHNIDTVLFDLDGTICRYERSSGEVLSLAFERVGVQPFFDQADYYGRFEQFVDESDDMATLRTRCFVDIAEERGRSAAVARAVADAFEAERDHSRVEFVDGAGELLPRLAREYGLGLVTNGHPEMQTAKLDSLGIADLFDVAVFAGGETRSKPHPEPFNSALDALRARPETTLFVGDLLDSDIAGARNVGMTTAWVSPGDTGPENPSNRDRSPTPDYVLDSTGELSGVLSGPGRPG